MFLVSMKISLLSCFLLFINFYHAEVINYNIYYNSVPLERRLVQDNTKTITEILNILTTKAVSNNSFSFQDGIEYLLLYGALLRNEIITNFGQLIYNHYQELSVSEIEALQKINLQISERKYNIFNLLPEIFKNGNLSPASICKYMTHSHISLCLKKYTVICMNTAAGHNDLYENILNTTSFSISRKIYQSMRGSRSNLNRFSATTVMRYMNIDEINATSGLFLGLLLNVQYDNYNHNIQTAERHVSHDLFLQLATDTKKVYRKGFKKYDSLNLLVKNNLLVYVSERAKNYANYLNQHIYIKPTAVDEKIELLAFIYGNKSVNLKHLFELILPNDTLDADVIDARDYLRVQLEKQDILRDFLQVNKYQQTSPDQLLLEILMQIQELNFMTDIASTLYTHALFWHQSHAVENLGQLLELFNAFNNLRLIPTYNKFMDNIYQIKYHLKDSLNTDIDIRCTRPRVCLKMGLKILAHCDSIDNTTVRFVNEFLKNYKSGCDSNNEIGLLDSSTFVNWTNEKLSTLALSETSTSATSTLKLSSTSTLASVILKAETSTAAGMITESYEIHNNYSFPKELNPVTQENNNNTQEDTVISKKESTLELINLTSSENNNLTQHEQINSINFNNNNSAKDQEDSSCESGEECGDDDVQAIGDQQPTTIAPKNDLLVSEGYKEGNSDSNNNDKEVVGISTDSVSCKLKGCYEPVDSTVDDLVISLSSHSSKIDETTQSNNNTTIISVENIPTHQLSTTTTPTTLRPKKKKIICRHWNRRQHQKANKSKAVTEVLSNKKLYNHQKNDKQAPELKDVEDRLSEAKVSLTDDTFSQESLEKVYYQNSEYDDENNPSAYNYPNKLEDSHQSLIDETNLGSKISSNEIKNRLLDINTPKFFNFEIKRDETISDYNTQKKREISTDESLDDDIDDRVLDWNSPKFFNFEIKRDETNIGDIHNNMEMSLDSHDTLNTNKMSRSKRHACNKTANALLNKNKSVDKTDVTSNIDVKNRLLDWNAQKFFNFEIKRDESVSTNHSRARRNIIETRYTTSSTIDDVDRATKSFLLMVKHVNSSAMNNHSEMVKNDNNSSDVGIGKYLMGSSLTKLFNLDVKRNDK